MACIADGAAIEPVQKTATKYFSSGKGGMKYGYSKAHPTQARAHRGTPGFFEWRITWKALIRTKSSAPNPGVSVDWSRTPVGSPFVTPVYECDLGPNAQCLFAFDLDE